MYDPVGEARGKDLAFDGMFDDEGHAAAHAIGAIFQLVVQAQNLILHPQLEFELIDGIAFVSPGIVIGREEIFEQFFRHE